MLQVYDPIEPGARPLLPTYVIFLIFSCFMTLLIFIRWRERRKKVSLLLFITFIIYTICLVVLTLGIAEAVITGEKRMIYRFSLAFGYAGIMVANCFLILFATEIFSIKMQHVTKYLVLSLLIAMAVALPWNYYGQAGIAITKTLRPYTSISMALFSILTYTKIYKQATRVIRIVDEPIAKAGFRYIAWSQFGMIFFFIFMFADLALMGLTGLKGYTPFAFMAWASAALFLGFSYLGLIMPDWLKKHYEKTDKKNQ